MVDASILAITDGTTPVNLFDLNLIDWTPATAPWKDGGIFSSSPFSDRTALVSRQFTATPDSFTFSPSKSSQDIVIAALDKLFTLLEKATAYQTSRWQNEPVWIEARGSCETNSRYALVIGYQMPRLSNPYDPPFASEALSTLEDFTLVILHEIWQDEIPGESHCIKLNSLQTVYKYPSATVVSNILDLADNGTFSEGEDSLIPSSTAGASLHLGTANYQRWSTFLIFRDITHIDHTTMISDARLRVISPNASANTDVYVRVTALKNLGEYHLTPNLYTAEDTSRMPRTNAYVDILLAGVWAHGTAYYLDGLAPILQELVNDPEWEVGQEVCFIIDSSPFYARSGTSKEICGYGDGVHDAPRLQITECEYDSVTMGQEDTCEDHVFLANKHHAQQLTDFIIYDLSATLYVHHDLRVASPVVPYTLLPGTPADGDILYIGIGADVGDKTGNFSNVILDLSYFSSSASMIYAMTYTYWSSGGGPGWVALTHVYDETEMFSKSGVRGIFFEPPPTWIPNTVDGQSAYWIKLEVVSCAGVGYPPIQNNRNIYTANDAFADISESECEGDISSLAKTLVHARFNDTHVYYQNSYLAVRSYSRGMDFNPYLNCTDVVLQTPGLAASYLTADSSFIGDVSTPAITSPTGRMGMYSPAVGAVKARTSEFRWTFDDTLAYQYKGKFAVYLRYYQSSANPYLKVGLNLVWGGMYNYQTDQVLVDYVHDATYLGVIDLSLGAGPGERFFSHYIDLTIEKIVAQPVVLYVYDLILVPVDEFTILVKPPTAWRIGVTVRLPWMGNGYIVDSVDYPKDLVRVFHRDESNDDLTIAIDHYTQGPWCQQTGRQRIWYFGFGYVNLYSIHHIVSLQQFAVSRYALGMRGSG